MGCAPVTGYLYLNMVDTLIGTLNASGGGEGGGIQSAHGTLNPSRWHLVPEYTEQ